MYHYDSSSQLIYSVLDHLDNIIVLHDKKCHNKSYITTITFVVDDTRRRQSVPATIWTV